MTRRFLANPACSCKGKGYTLTFVPAGDSGVGIRAAVTICTCVVMLPEGLEPPPDRANEPTRADFFE